MEIVNKDNQSDSSFNCVREPFAVVTQLYLQHRVHVPRNQEGESVVDEPAVEEGHNHVSVSNQPEVTTLDHPAQPHGPETNQYVLLSSSEYLKHVGL